MIKSKSALIIVSSLLLCVLSGLLTYFGLSTVGLVDAGKQPLVIELTETSKVYDGTEVVPSGYKIVDGVINDNHTLVVEYDSSQTYVGNAIVTGKIKVLDQNQNDVTNEYVITCKSTTVKVTKRPIKIAPLETSKVYDGTPITGEDFEIIEGSLAVGDSLSPSFTVLDSNDTVGDYTCSVEAKVYNSAGYDVTDNYDIQTERSVITIDKKPIVITTDSVSKVYDLKNNLEILTSHISEGSLNVGHYYEPKFKTIDQTEVGTYDIELESVIVYDSNGNDVSDNYAIVFNNTGKLTIEKFELEIITESNSFKFDGQEHFEEGFTINQIHNVFLEENLINVKVDTSTKITNSGQMSNVLSFKIFDKIGTDISSNFILDIKYGTLIVSDADVTIRVLDQSKVFDNENIDLDKEAYQVIGPSKDAFMALVNDDAKDLDVKLYLVGDEENFGVKDSGQYTIYAEVLGDLQDNFKVDIIAGSYTVSPAEVILTVSDSFEKVYDGTNQFNFTTIMNSYVISGSGKDYFNSLNNIDVNLFTKEEAVNAGKYEVTASVNLESDNNVYVVVEDGTLTINKKDLSLAPIDLNNKMYDGKPFTYQSDSVKDLNNGIITKDEDLLSINVLYNGSKDEPVNVGEYTVSISNHNELLDLNYNVSYGNTSTIIITKANVSLKPIDKTKVYDDEAVIYSSEDFFVSNGYMAPADLLLVKPEISINNNALEVGTYEASISQYNSELDLNYNINLESTNFEIKKREITISPVPVENKVYDGKEFIYDTKEYIVKKGTIIPNHIKLFDLNLKATFNGSQENPINVGVYNVSFAEITESMNALIYKNYKVIVDSNVSFEITKANVKISPIELGSKVYDGIPFAYDTSQYNVVSGNIYENDLNKLQLIINSTPIPNPVNVGTYEFEIVSTNGALDNNYNIEFEGISSLEITPRDITVKPLDSFDNKYSGETHHLDVSAFEIIDGSLATGDEFTINSLDNSVDIKDVNNYSVIISNYSIKNSTDNDVKSNYNVVLEEGLYEITPKEVVLELKVSDSKLTPIYNGEPNGLTAEDLEVASDQILPVDRVGLKYVVEYIDENNNVCTPENVGIYSIRVVGLNKELNNYSFTYESTLELEIKAKKVEITYKDFETVYTGKNITLSKDNVISNTEGLIDGHSISCINARKDGADFAEAILTYYDVTECEFTEMKVTIVDEEGNDVTENYTIENTNTSFKAKYTADGRLIQFSTTPLEKVYDGSGFKLAYQMETDDIDEMFVPYFDLKVSVASQLPSNCFYYISDLEYETADLSTAEGYDICEGSSDANVDMGGEFSVIEITIYTYDDEGQIVDVTDLFNINDGEDVAIQQIIRKADIVITANDFTKTYDGEEVTAEQMSYSVTGTSVNEFNYEVGNNIELIIDGYAVNTGSYNIEVDDIDSDNFNIYTIPGKVTIKKANILVTVNNASKVYDGEEYGEFNYTVTGDSVSAFIDECNVSVDECDEVDAGIYPLYPKYDSNDNFLVQEVEGKLTITKADITISGTTITTTYTGNTVDVSNAYTVSGTNASLYDGAITAECDEVDAGAHKIEISYTDDPNFNIKANDGLLIINKADLIVSALNITKTYDADSIDLSSAYTLSGNGAAYYDGTITVDCDDTINVGTYEIKVEASDDSNFNITCNNGMLVINKANLTISLNTITVDIDDDDDTIIDEVTVNEDDFVITAYNDYDNIANTISFTLTISAVGTYTVVPTITADLSNYNINIIPGYVVAHM